MLFDLIESAELDNFALFGKGQHQKFTFVNLIFGSQLHNAFQGIVVGNYGFFIIVFDLLTIQVNGYVLVAAFVEDESGGLFGLSDKYRTGLSRGSFLEAYNQSACSGFEQFFGFLLKIIHYSTS
jgi:hypothetical protein